MEVMEGYPEQTDGPPQIERLLPARDTTSATAVRASSAAGNRPRWIRQIFGRS